MMVLSVPMASDSPALASLKGTFDGHHHVTTHSVSPFTKAPPLPHASGHRPSHDWLSPSQRDTEE